MAEYKRKDENGNTLLPQKCQKCNGTIPKNPDGSETRYRTDAGWCCKKCFNSHISVKQKEVEE